MISVEEAAVHYIKRIIDLEGGGLNIRVEVADAGTHKATCQLALCPKGTQAPSDAVVMLDGFNLYLPNDALPYLEGAAIQLKEEGITAELMITAPKIRGDELPSLFVRIEQFLQDVVNPMLASHKGMCSLVDILDDNTVVLKFGGGCHGCGMVDVTLKQGIEKQLKAEFKEVYQVIDSTVHAEGKNPYYQAKTKGGCHV